MKTICNDRDLRVAYEILQILADKNLTAKNIERVREHTKKIKRAIREYRDRNENMAQIVRSDFDSMLVVLPLPQHLETKECATEYFLDHYFLEARPSAYDCTGQVFTSWYKIFRRRGQFWAYHATAMDV